jgi:hypothetical protein
LYPGYRTSSTTVGKWLPLQQWLKSAFAAPPFTASSSSSVSSRISRIPDVFVFAFVFMVLSLIVMPRSVGLTAAWYSSNRADRNGARMCADRNTCSKRQECAGSFSLTLNEAIQLRVWSVSRVLDVSSRAALAMIHAFTLRSASKARSFGPALFV